MENFQEGFIGDLFKQTIWDAARSFIEFEFNTHMNKLKDISDVAWKLTLAVGQTILKHH